MFGALALVLLVALGGLAFDAATRARDARSAVASAEIELRRAQGTVQALASLDGGHLPTAQEIESALVSVQAAHAHLERAEDRLGYVETLLPVAAVLPPADGAEEVPALLDLGLDVTDAAGALLTAVLPLLQPPAATGGDEPSSLAELLRRVFVEDTAVLDQALTDLDALRPEVERLRERSWGGWLDAAPAALDLLDDALAEVPRAREAFGAISTGLDPLFGFDRPKTYLVAGLNEAEVRPTGGFMGTLGVVTVERGRITDSNFERVLSFELPQQDYPAPPDDLQATMGAPRWLLRDANWWPDFPTSARATLDLFEVNQGFRPDGVIALNTLFTADLVEVFAPLDLPEYPQPLTAANWRGLMESQLLEGREEGPLVPLDRPSAEEAYIHPLMEALLARSQSPSPEQLPALLAALATGSRARNVQGYVADSDGQHLLDTMGASGRLEAPPQGTATLAVVDSNVSWSKVGPGISRETFVLLGERGIVDMVVDWTNHVSRLDPVAFPRANGPATLFRRATQEFEAATGMFGNYVRVYLPATARAIDIQGSVVAPRISHEGGFVVVGAQVVLGDGESARVTVSYRDESPLDILHIWKQGGVVNDRLRVARNTDGMQSIIFDGPFTSDVVLDTSGAP